jgi:hypothetical protein
MTTLGHPSADPASAYLGYGLPADRQARIAARRAFVEMKADLMCACAVLPGAYGERLRQRVRQATEAVDLWRLRGAILVALPEAHPRTPGHRSELLRQLSHLFPDSQF